jgi:hypothetical protein
MFKITFDDLKFNKEMENILGYSLGFLEGVEKGKENFLRSFAPDIIRGMKDFIDSNARVDPQMYHHIYEWYQTGSANSILYNIKYRVNKNGISLNYSFSQSKSIQNGSKEPFYNKATIMENGVAVTIKPQKSNVLAFVVDGQQVFTKKEVVVSNPGGTRVKGSFEHIINLFLSSYFKQSFLQSSGIRDYLQKPLVFKTNLKSAKTGGKNLGEQVGYNWISHAGGLNV